MTRQTRLASGKFSTYLALASFGIGTLFLIANLLFPYVWQIIIFGFLYLILAFLLNGIVLINLVYQFIVYRADRDIIGFRILILLFNIPIAFLYLNIIFHNTYSN
jgi:hypothetical protein